MAHQVPGAGLFSYAGVPFEAYPDSAGNYRDIGTPQPASVREIPYSNPRKLIVDEAPNGRSRLGQRIRVRPDQLAALEAKRDGIHWLVFNGKRRKAGLVKLAAQPASRATPPAVDAWAEFVIVPDTIDADD